MTTTPRPTEAPELYRITRNGISITVTMRPTLAAAHIAAGRRVVLVGAR